MSGTVYYSDWRCFFWHKWRWDVRRDRSRDLCVRSGCGVIRPHQVGTRAEV